MGCGRVHRTFSWAVSEHPPGNVFIQSLQFGSGVVTGWSLNLRRGEFEATRSETVSNVLVDVQTVADGTVVVRPHGAVGAECAVELRQVLVHAVRRLRPHRLILDFADVCALDSINVGTVAAVCDLAADHQVVLFVDHATAAITAHLQDAGVHHRHLRSTRPAGTPAHAHAG